MRSKLELYKNGTPEKQKISPKGDKEIDQLVSGREVINDNGSFFMVENRYPLSWLHGGISLGNVLDLDFSVLKKVFSELYHGLSIQDFLFLDTETTGLSGGAGTVAFLTGLGYFSEDCYIQQQFFIRDYDEEAAMLTALNEHLARHKGLVTFNGKGFDWNLLLSRFACNRMRPALRAPIHMDLLFPSRRIWKIKLESCRLVSLEENILGEYRIDDIPGAMIPYAYFKYLDTRDASEMVKVIEHNASDIMSMVSLLWVIASKLESPHENADEDRRRKDSRIHNCTL